MRSLRVLAAVVSVLVSGGAYLTVGVADRPAAEQAARGAPMVVAVRTAGVIPPGAAADVDALPGVTSVVAVGESQHGLTSVRDAAGGAAHAWAEGWAVPIDLLHADPVAFARLLPPGPDRSAIQRLRVGDVLLGSTEAGLRGIGPGGVLQLGDRALRVVGVVDDHVINTAGGFVHNATFPDRPHRFLLVGHAAAEDRSITMDRARAAGLQPRDLGRAPWRTTWREVTPLAALKAYFGEFAIADAPGRRVRVDPAWQAANITTRSVPILGEVTCHRLVLDDLSRALDRIVAAGLADWIDPGDYAGCYSPRAMRTDGPLSRHAFGIAVDVNASTNRHGAVPTLDPRVVEIFEEQGFWWGGRWPNPDGMHFEHRGR